MTTAEILFKIAQFILSLSILIILHELGHFIPSKIFKARVEKFYLFFDPWFSLFKFKKGETEYGVGWLPLGGYCKISGMVDESMDKEQMKQPPKPWEFRSKPAWQRLIIMVGGVTMNILFAFFIYWMMMWHWGQSYLPAKNLRYGIEAGKLAQQIGLKDGDKIIAIDHKPVVNFDNIPKDIILEEAKSIQIVRNGQQMNIAIPDGFIREVVKNKGESFLTLRWPVIVDSVLPSAKFLVGKLQKNDQIFSVNGQPAFFSSQFEKDMNGLKNTQANLGVIRNGTDTIYVKAQINQDGLIGFGRKTPYEIRHYSFLAAFPTGIHKGITTMKDYVQQLRLIFFSKEIKASESLGGFISIGNLFPAMWDWYGFWSMTALISIILAIMNILPIPALDGGHVLFLMYEIITKRKPSDKFLEYAQIAGMAILIGLVLYANGLDIWRHLMGH